MSFDGPLKRYAQAAPTGYCRQCGAEVPYTHRACDRHMRDPLETSVYAARFAIAVRFERAG